MRYRVTEALASGCPAPTARPDAAPTPVVNAHSSLRPRAKSCYGGSFRPNGAPRLHLTPANIASRALRPLTRAPASGPRART
jgi:hypothetical protein